MTSVFRLGSGMAITATTITGALSTPPPKEARGRKQHSHKSVVHSMIHRKTAAKTSVSFPKALACVALVLVAIVTALLVAFKGTGGTADATSNKHNNTNGKLYLYHTDTARDVIVDYEPSADSSNFKPDFLYAPNQGPRVVEFYAPWCGHCQHFAKHYVELARKVGRLLDESSSGNAAVERVDFYAVSCTANPQVCRNMKIRGYPTIQLFAAHANSTMAVPVKYHKLHPRDVLTKLGVNQVDPLGFSDTESGTETSLLDTDSSIVLGGWPKRTKQQVFHDAYLSFDFNLRNGIFTSDDPLTNTTKAVFRDWLELLKQTTPVVWRIQSLIQAILADFDFAMASAANLVSIADKYTPSSSSNGTAAAARWSPACTKGKPGMGYTCGLWQLFHIVSVGVVEYNVMIGTAQDDNQRRVRDLSISTVHAADTVRNFVEHFFGCEECRVNFLHEYDACALDRCNRLAKDATNATQWMQFSLWLFETHNSVNHRLLQEKATEEGTSVSLEKEQLRQWPPKESCPLCWLDTGGWNEEVVYKYLRMEYWSEDLLSASYRAEILGTSRSSGLHSIRSALLFLGLPMMLSVAWWCKRGRRCWGQEKLRSSIL